MQVMRISTTQVSSLMLRSKKAKARHNDSKTQQLHLLINMNVKFIEMEYHEIAYAVMLRLFFRNFTHDKIRETM
jgi:hypothetical protein